MKKVFAILVLVLLALLCACDQVPDDITEPEPVQITTPAPHKHVTELDSYVAPTCTEPGLSVGSHCSKCGEILTEQKVIEALGHKYTFTCDRETHSGLCSVCQDAPSGAHVFEEGGTACTVCPFHVETPPESVKGFITTELTYIETEYALYEIEANIYVREDIAELTDELCRTMEKVSGLSFKTEHVQGKKILISVSRDGVEGVETEQSQYVARAVAGECTSQRGDACKHTAVWSPAEFFIGGGSVPLHELAHVLRFSQNEVKYNTVLEEGFASFVEMACLRYLEEQKSELCFALGTSYKQQNNLACLDDGLLNIYDHDMKYWFSQPAEYYRPYGNHNYCFGMCFLTYLKATYGECFSWLAIDAKRENTTALLSVDEEMALFFQRYGENCFEGFYPWLRANSKQFDTPGPHGPMLAKTPAIYDAKGMPPVVMYPYFFISYLMDYTTLCDYSMAYENLYICLDETRYYLETYKGRNVDGLRLLTSSPVTVQLFDAEGYLLGELADTREIPLKEVSYVKLVGKGVLDTMQLVGYYNPDHVYTEPTVVYSKTISNGVFVTSNLGMMESEFDFGLLYRDDVTVTLRLTGSCEVSIVDDEWKTTWYKYSTAGAMQELVISDTVYVTVQNEYGSVDIQIVVTPK